MPAECSEKTLISVMRKSAGSMSKSCVYGSPDESLLTIGFFLFGFSEIYT